MRLARESAVDKTSGRVGANPAAIMKLPPGPGMGNPYSGGALAWRT